jgi:preprotein translocase subunit SecA
MEEDVPIESKMITKRIAAAQKAVEAQNFAARKHLLEYDDVMNKQRKAIYALRRSLLEGGDQKETILDYVKGILGSYLEVRVPEGSRPDQWDLQGLQSDVLSQFGVKIHVESLAELGRDEIEERIYEQLARRYNEKEALVSAEVLRETERIVMLNVIDAQWKDHLLSMDHLKEGIGLRGYGQKDPLVEYKKESFGLFEAMRDRIEDETVRWLFFLQPAESLGLPFASEEEEVPEEDEGGPLVVAVTPEQRRSAQSTLTDFTRNIQRKKEKELAEVSMAGASTAAAPKQVIKGKHVGRNDPCPCGSGRKYKKCCGA